VYEITSAIGAGGMGEVYRARDTRLQRDVALKILPEAFASDPERLARFEREAQMLAALNHPHIAAIHGIEESGGVRALVLELVDGETLADRIATGAIPVDETIPIARQIADALEAAHEQGIVHRDLKPSNIKVRSDGTVKVLDFGLAKLAAGVTDAGSKDPAYTVSPTITTPAMTQIGVIMGTAAYMSPEQAKGREADKRSDVWAFGAVLYEMLTGRRAFDGDDMSDTFASVLKIDPDWTRLPADLPPALRTLIQRCLAKDRRQRVADISAATFVLSELSMPASLLHTSSMTLPREPARARTRWIPLVATAVITAAIVGGVMWAWRATPEPRTVSKFSLLLPEGVNFSGTVRQSIAISPDGTNIAFTGNGRVYLRSIGDLLPHSILGTEGEGSDLGVLQPMFSPDGASIAFLTFSGIAGTNHLKRIPITGGAAVTLTTFDNGEGTTSGSWGPDGILLGGQRGIRRVSANGGAIERIAEVGPDEEAQAPEMLPDGRTLLFTVAKRSGSDRWDKAQVIALSLKDRMRRVLVDGGSDAHYLRTGHLIFAVGGTEFARAFDPRTLTFTGSQAGRRRRPPIGWRQHPYHSPRGLGQRHADLSAWPSSNVVVGARSAARRRPAGSGAAQSAFGDVRPSQGLARCEVARRGSSRRLGIRRVALRPFRTERNAPPDVR
jgi:eukaryotic-like serine/threonine-protein kinase